MSSVPPNDAGSAAEPTLLRQVSRSVFWNSVLLPLVTFLNLVLSIVIRRGFGLQSGIYDILLGVLSSLLYYSSLGIPMSLQKFVPEAKRSGGRKAVLALLLRAGVARMATIVAVLIPMNLFADTLAERFALGPEGVAYLRILSVLIVFRGLLELAHKTLGAELAQLPANLLALAQAILEPALIGLSLVLGYGMGGVLGSLTFTAAILALGGGALVHRILGLGPPAVAETAEAPVAASEIESDAVHPAGGVSARTRSDGLWRFAIFTWLFELSLYFGTPAFAKPALAGMLGDHEAVALFSTAYYVAFMTVTMVVAGFRGIYRPLFARLRAEGDPRRLRTAFTAVSKVQVALLLPVGVGLGILVADYLPLLYGAEFLPAVPLARWFVLLLFTEAAFNLGIILLWVDERWREVFAAQAVTLLGAPLFLWSAAAGGLTAAVVSLGAIRVGSVVAGYLAARRAFDLRFPWAFTARVAAVAAVMGLVLLVGRSLWPTSLVEATVLTITGGAVFALGIRIGGVLGEEEIDLIRRASIPGGRWLLQSLSRAPVRRRP